MAAIEDIILKKRNNLNSLLSMRKGTAVVYVACPSCGKETAEPELVAENPAYAPIVLTGEDARLYTAKADAL